MIDDSLMEILNWPARSPDVNPVENLRGLMVQGLNKIADKKGEASNRDELFKRVNDVWIATNN